MKQSKYSDAQITSILKQAENGVPVGDLCRERLSHHDPFVHCLLSPSKYGVKATPAPQLTG